LLPCAILVKELFVFLYQGPLICRSVTTLCAAITGDVLLQGIGNTEKDTAPAFNLFA
jgi:hypothetical protein